MQRRKRNYDTCDLVMATILLGIIIASILAVIMVFVRMGYSEEGDVRNTIDMETGKIEHKTTIFNGHDSRVLHDVETGKIEVETGMQNKTGNKVGNKTGNKRGEYEGTMQTQEYPGNAVYILEQGK